MRTRAPRTTNGLYKSADDDANARTSSSMPTRCPQSHDPRVGGLANRTSTTAADRYQWTLVPATNAPSRPHAPNAMRGRLNPTTRVARAHRNAAATSTRSRLRTMSIFVFVLSDRASRARGPNPTALEWTGAHRTSAIRARRSSTSRQEERGEASRGQQHTRMREPCRPSLFFFILHEPAKRARRRNPTTITITVTIIVTRTIACARSSTAR